MYDIYELSLFAIIFLHEETHERIKLVTKTSTDYFFTDQESQQGKLVKKYRNAYVLYEHTIHKRTKMLQETE